MDDSDPKSAAPSDPGWLRAHARWLAVVAALLLLYTLGGFLLLPYLAGNAIVHYIQKDLGRHATIGQLNFNPFTFTLEIHQFALAEADDRPVASFARLRVSASLSASLLHRAWSLSEVQLEQPVVHLRVERDGSVNLAKLAPATPEKPPKPEASAGALPAVRITALGVHGGRVQFQDLSRSEPFAATLSPIEFDLADFRTAPKFENKYRFSAQSGAGERLDWAGEFTLRPLGSNGEFTITALRASTVADYLQNALPFALTGGSLDVQGHYEFVATPVTALSLRLPRIQLHNLGVAPADTAHPTASGATATLAAAPWISLPELDIADTAVVLNERRIAIGAITVQRAALKLWRDADGSLNLQQLMRPAPATAAATAPAGAAAVPADSAGAAATAAWNIELKRLELQDAEIEAEDRSVSPAFKLPLSAIGLTVQNYSSGGTEPLKFDLHLRLGASGALQTQGTVALSTLDSALDLDLSGLDLPAFQPYVAQSTNLTLYRGRLGVKGHVAYAPASAPGQPQLQAALAVELADLATRDNVMNEDLVSARALRIEGLHYQMAPDALRIERIVALAPYGRVVIGAQGGLNVADALRAPRAQPAQAQTAAPIPAAKPKAPAAKRNASAARSAVAAASAAKPASRPMPIRIARIEVRDGVANFTDRSVTPNFSSAIYGLKGSVVGLSSDPASRATVTLDGSVDRYAPVSIKGQINVLSATAYTDIAMSFSNIELPTFNPYSGKFAGYNIAQGKLSTQMQYHVENRKLDAKHHIVIDQLEFGAATESKQAVPLPIKLAVSLLKDRNGVITLDLPVGGSLDDPTFRIGPIVWKMFVNLVTKIVTAPFALLGSLFGGGPELSYIDFPAGVATLTSAQIEKLTKLSNALIERPQVKLDIPLHTQTEADDVALERAGLEQALSASAAVPAAGKHPRGAKAAAPAPATAAGAATATPAAAEHLAKLAALYRAQFTSDPQYPPETASAADPDADRASWLEQQLLPQFAPNAQARDALGQARAQAVQQAVLANTALAPQRVFLVNQASGGGAEGAVRMELKLE
jgi:uncharacterized protein involved in outer membrane biogenesis